MLSWSEVDVYQVFYCCFSYSSFKRFCKVTNKYEGSTVDCFIFFSFLENWVDEGYVYVFMSLVPSDYWLTKLLNVKEFF